MLGLAATWTHSPAVAPAVAGGAPAGAGHVVHRCPATLLIRSREAPRAAPRTAAGGLPADSPLPGQSAGLCEQLGVTGHGITAAPRRDLPEPWRSVAAYHLGENPGAGTHAASAPVAVVLPELDGVRYAVAGLHTGYGQT